MKYLNNLKTSNQQDLGLKFLCFSKKARSSSLLDSRIEGHFSMEVF